jgi:hypothetical protein
LDTTTSRGSILFFIIIIVVVTILIYFTAVNVDGPTQKELLAEGKVEAELVLVIFFAFSKFKAIRSNLMTTIIAGFRMGSNNGSVD